MAAITEVFTGDRQLQLGREQYIRPLVIGSNWNKLRVGFRYTMHIPRGSNATVTMAYGLTCQSKQWYDANADMVYTLYSETGLNAAPTYLITNQGTYGTSNFLRCVNQTKVGSTLNTSAGGTNSTSLCVSITTRGILATDFTRGSGTITTQAWGRNNTVPTDQTQADFLVNMENESPPFLSTTSMPASSALTYAGTGLLDSFWFYWSNQVPLINISDIAVCRFY